VSSSRDRDPIEITEHELTAMTVELDDMHHDSMPKLYESVAEWAEMGNVRRSIGGAMSSRRGFLTGSGLALGGLILAACGSSKKSTPTTVAPGTTPTTAAAAPDLQIAALATSLENLAVATYQAGIDAATAGHLGSVPPAVVTFAKTAQSQHKDHAAAWNAILSGAGKPMVTGVDMTVKTTVVDPAFAKVTDVAGLAMLALGLEEVAAATYLSGISLLQSPGGIKTSASIHPVEMQHAAILNFVLGQYPVPNSFAMTTGARGLSDKIG
jgi:predicted outer membrane protein